MKAAPLARSVVHQTIFLLECIPADFSFSASESHSNLKAPDVFDVKRPEAQEMILTEYLSQGRVEMLPVSLISTEHTPSDDTALIQQRLNFGQFKDRAICTECRYLDGYAMLHPFDMAIRVLWEFSAF